MKKSTSTLLEKLRHLFDKKLKRQEEKRKQLKLLLRKLKKDEQALREKIEKNSNPERKAHFERHVKVLHQQRTKGIALLRKLNKE